MPTRSAGSAARPVQAASGFRTVQKSRLTRLRSSAKHFVQIAADHRRHRGCHDIDRLECTFHTGGP
jgi:hypothetical protein